MHVLGTNVAGLLHVRERQALHDAWEQRSRAGVDQGVLTVNAVAQQLLGTLTVELGALGGACSRHHQQHRELVQRGMWLCCGAAAGLLSGQRLQQLVALPPQPRAQAVDRLARLAQHASKHAWCTCRNHDFR